MWEGPHEQTTLLAKHPLLRYSSVERDAANDCDECQSAAADMPTQGAVQPARRLGYYLVEPVVLLLLFAYNLSSTIMKNQIIYQTCVAVFAYNETDCRELGTKNASDHAKHIETLVQPYAARLFMTSTLIESVVPALCGAFIGAWSDRYGRRPLLITAYTGYALFYVLAAVIAWLASMSVVSPWYYVLAVLPEALLGGSVTYSVAAWCYISDVSSESERPYRMAVYEAVVYTGLMLGSFCAGYIYEATSATAVFAISAATIVLALFIIICCVPESLHVRQLNATSADEHTAEQPLTTNAAGLESEIAPETVPETVTETVTETAPLTKTDSEKLRGLFDWKLLQEMLQVSFQPRSYADRAIIWLAIVALLISVFTIAGSMNVFYLFVRQQFHWTVKQFTTYETIDTLVPIVGNLLGLWLLRKWLQISVVTLAIIAFLSQVVSHFMKGFAVAAWQLYLAIALGVFKSLGNPMCRTIITKVVPPNELGKVFCCHKVLEALVPFVAAPVYTVIYSITLTTFPGFFNLLSANLLLLVVACLLGILRKKQHNPDYYGAILN